MVGTWGHAHTRFRIKRGWFDAGREGEAFAFFADNKGQCWVVLQYDEDDDPDLYKADGVEVQRVGSAEWEPMQEK